MHATTHYGEFTFRKVDEGSELAGQIQRMLCQLRHPSMAGRPVHASGHLSKLLGPEAQPSG